MIINWKSLIGNHYTFNISFDSLAESEERLFLYWIEKAENALGKSNSLYDEYGVDLLSYEENFVHIIETLTYLSYGKLLGDIIGWYLFERKDRLTGEILTITRTIEEENGNINQHEYTLKTPQELWNFIQIVKQDIEKAKE